MSLETTKGRLYVRHMLIFVPVSQSGVCKPRPCANPCANGVCCADGYICVNGVCTLNPCPNGPTACNGATQVNQFCGTNCYCLTTSAGTQCLNGGVCSNCATDADCGGAGNYCIRNLQPCNGCKTQDPTKPYICAQKVASCPNSGMKIRAILERRKPKGALGLGL